MNYWNTAILENLATKVSCTYAEKQIKFIVHHWGIYYYYFKISTVGQKNEIMKQVIKYFQTNRCWNSVMNSATIEKWIYKNDESYIHQKKPQIKTQNQ